MRVAASPGFSIARAKPARARDRGGAVRPAPIGAHARGRRRHGAAVESPATAGTTAM